MRLKGISIDEWKQFDEVQIDFHPRLTVIAGANGSGKTTILNILSHHFGWNIKEMATPQQEKRGLWAFLTRWPRREEAPGDSFGTVTYENGASAELRGTAGDTASYDVKIQGAQPLSGFYIPAHRPVFLYQDVSALPRRRTKRQAFGLVSNSLRDRTMGGGGRPTSYHIKETLLTWLLRGPGNDYVDAEPELVALFEGFQRILRQILPEEIGFEGFRVRQDEVVLCTQSGEFILDAVSAGVGALIDIAWQIFLYEPSEKDDSFVVLIDEIESHLHASMQRRVLPDLVDAFPSVQFIVATHSPHVVGSVRDSAVYALVFDAETPSRVRSQLLDLEEKAMTAAEILRDILGVQVTMPIWAEKSLSQIISGFSSRELSRSALQELRVELEHQGLGSYVPEAIIDLLGADNDKSPQGTGS